MADRVAITSETTQALVRRLWREHVRGHRGLLTVIFTLTLVMAGTQALYPIAIDHAFSMFERKDQRILYQLPVLVVVITSVKALAQYFQNVAVQKVVLLVIRALQERMFAHLSAGDLARMEREAPASWAARFTTDATIIREALTRAVNGIADALTVVGLVGSMLWLDWKLSLIAAVLYPIAGIPIQRIGKRIRRQSSGMQEQIGVTAALLVLEVLWVRMARAQALDAVCEAMDAAPMNDTGEAS